MDEVVLAPRRNLSGMLSSRISGASPSRSPPLLPTCSGHVEASKSGGKLKYFALIGAVALLMMLGGYSSSDRLTSREAALDEVLSVEDKPAHHREMYQTSLELHEGDEASRPMTPSSSPTPEPPMRTIPEPVVLEEDPDDDMPMANEPLTEVANADEEPASAPITEPHQTSGPQPLAVEPLAAAHRVVSVEDEDSARAHSEAIAKMERTRQEHAATAAVAGCLDASSNCRTWASAGECKRNPVFMHKQCRWSCGVCGSGAPWVEGYLGGAHAFDEAEEEEEVIPTVGAHDPSEEVEHEACRDMAAAGSCDKWAAAGECERNSHFMHRQCKRSCGRCPVAVEMSASAPASLAAALESAVPRPMSREEQAAAIRQQQLELAEQRAATAAARLAAAQPAPKESDAVAATAGQREIAVKESGPCADEDERCELWANANECRLNPKFMHVKCSRSCGLCDV